MSQQTGVFTISLDFELHWGVFDNVALDGKEFYFDNTLKSIPEVIALLEQNNIAATWAVVGLLFNNSLESIKQNHPALLPNYKNNALSAYSFLEKNVNEKNLKYYKAPDLIDLIGQADCQEIGTHTYAHYYTLEQGQTKEEFESDLLKSIEIAKSKNIQLESIVFPRNQINNDYLEVCEKYGINNIRVNPKRWFWNTEKKFTLAKKIVRSLDCYIPLFKSTHKLDGSNWKDNGLLLLPASRFLKPVSSRNSLNKLRLKRIKNEMTLAAKNKEYYHLWWHPHNFGNHPLKAQKELQEIINHFNLLKKKYNMASLSMAEVRKNFY